MANENKDINIEAEGRTPASYSDRQQRRINRRRKKRTQKEVQAQKAAADPKKSVKQTKKQKKKNGRRSPGRRVLSGILLLILAALVITVVAGGIFVTYAVMTAEEIDPSTIYEQLDTTSILFDDEGNELEPVSTAESRTIVTYDQIPDHVKNAFIAIEDKTFYRHNGFNIIRIFGAIKEKVFGGGQIGGTSTITQQLARNLYLSKERTMTRKIQEAYYTVILEKELSKEDILTAYLNTIFLGYNSSGVQAAAQAYFGVDVSELSVAQAAVLAAIPKSPNTYAPMKKYAVEDVSEEEDDVIAYTSDGTYAIVYNDGYIDRQHMVIQMMYDQGLIDYGEWYAAMDEDIRVELFPQDTNYLTVASYFTDYCIQEVKEDLMKEYDLTDNDAEDMIYTGGLRIFTTLDVNLQETAEAEFERSSNFPSVTGITRDRRGNILNSNGNIMLYSRDTYLNDDESFTLDNDEYSLGDNGDLIILHGHRLNVYITETEDRKIPQIELKDMYYRDDGVFYTVRGGYLNNLPDDYLSVDEDGDAVISGEFIAQHPDYFQFGDNDTVTITAGNITLRQSTIQPQGAMVVTDYHTGQIKVMVGGRRASGRMIYNRANTTRQPGSSIKPIAVYGPALQSGLDLGTGYTAGTTIKDEEMHENGRVWPTNWYHGYRGYVTLRTCVEQSINTTAVRVVKDIGLDYSVEYLKKNGITSIVEEGATNDINAAALGLGGMTNGISPIQMASAYGTFPNGGLYIEPTTYTIVEDNQGNVILDSSKTSRTEQVYDEGIAWIMTSILQSTVTNGIAGRASIGNQPVGGKTGTTTDNYDAWFVGFTPQYAASVWIGNDVNIELSSGSGAAASLWSRIMRQLTAGFSRESFFDMPDNVYRRGGEYYVDGTSRKGQEADFDSSDSTEDEDSAREEENAEETETDENGNAEADNGGNNNNNNNNGNNNGGNNGGNNSGGNNSGGGGNNSGGGGNSSGGGGNSSGGGGRDYNDNPEDGLVND